MSTYNRYAPTAATVRHHHTREQVQALQEPWKRLEKRHPTPLASYDWFDAAMGAFSDLRTPAVVTLEREGRVTAMAPLGRVNRPLGPLEILGCSILREPGEVLYETERDLEELAGAMFRLGRPLHLWRLDAVSPVPDVLDRESRNLGWIAIRDRAAIPRVEVAGTWAEFEKQRISSSRRSSFRRLRRKTERLAGVEPRMEVHDGADGTLDEKLRQLYTVEGSGWKGRGGSSLTAHDTVRGFFERYARSSSRDGRLRMFVLAAGDRILAMQLAEEYARRLWIYKIGHDDTWSGVSPGIQLMHEVVRYCFEQGLDACEFLGSDEPWLQIWANGSDERVGYRLYPRSLAGRAGFVIDEASRLAHSGRNRFIRQSARAHRKSRPNRTGEGAE